jgi:photosynthetic reaction center H subunit
MNFARIKSNRVVIRSLFEKHMAGIPTIKDPTKVTLLEEEKIMAYYGGGTMYADPSREEPLL